LERKTRPEGERHNKKCGNSECRNAEMQKELKIKNEGFFLCVLCLIFADSAVIKGIRPKLELHRDALRRHRPACRRQGFTEKNSPVHHLTSSPVNQNPASSSKPGRRWRVRSTLCSCFHFAISLSLPESRTSGTFHPRNSAGRVNTGGEIRSS
jgi:hypothetical protein